MVRNVVGLAVFAGISLIILKFFFALLGMAFGLIGTLLWWALLGFIFYTILKIVSPSTARWVKELITGRAEA